MCIIQGKFIATKNFETLQETRKFLVLLLQLASFFTMFNLSFSTCKTSGKRERKRERDRETERQTDRETDRQRDRETERQRLQI